MEAKIVRPDLLLYFGPSVFAILDSDNMKKVWNMEK